MTDYNRFMSRAADAMRGSAIRRMGMLLAEIPDIISFAPGYPAPETFAWNDFREITLELLSGRDEHVLQYGPTRGHLPLLEAIVAIQETRGIDSRIDDLVVTTGSQQGLDLVARVLVDPGDVVLVELPSYTGAISAFRAVQATIVGVRQDRDGLDLDALDDTLKAQRAAGQRVRLLYVVPNFQNPTGLLIGLEKRMRLLEWAEANEVLIVEDDPYGELFFEDSATRADTRPIKAGDRVGRVVYLSSFSKTLAPGYRVGWISAPPALAAKFELAKQVADLCTGGLDQRVVFEAWHRGVLDRQIPRLRAHYQEKRDAMVSTLNAELAGVATWPAPRGGFFLWVTLPSQIDCDALLQRAIQYRVIYVAGSAFFVDGSGCDTMRLSFSAPPPQTIVDGIKRLALAIREELDQGSPATVPGRSADRAIP